MKNPCGTTRAQVFEHQEVNGIPVYFGAGVNPVNSPAQFFVAWGENVLAGGLVHTFNSVTQTAGLLWFVDEDEAAAEYAAVQHKLSERDKGVNSSS